MIITILMILRQSTEIFSGLVLYCCPSLHSSYRCRKYSNNLLARVLIMILLVNIATLVLLQPRYTFGLSTHTLSGYQNIRSKFKVDYPSDWKKISEVNLDNYFSNVLFATPDNQFPNLKSLFSITVEKFAFCRQSMSEIARESCVQSPIEIQSKRIVQELNDLKRNPYTIEYSNKNTTLSGLLAKRIIFKTSALGGLQKLEISSAHNDKLYTLTYIGKPIIFHKNIGVIETAIASFKIY